MGMYSVIFRTRYEIQM